jgi:hypothetical protein
VGVIGGGRRLKCDRTGLSFDAIGRIDWVRRTCNGLPCAGNVDAWRVGINWPRLAAGLFLFRDHLGPKRGPIRQRCSRL